MAIFNSYVKLPEGTSHSWLCHGELLEAIASPKKARTPGIPAERLPSEYGALADAAAHHAAAVAAPCGGLQDAERGLGRPWGQVESWEKAGKIMENRGKITENLGEI